jgi:hypothetical protein
MKVSPLGAELFHADGQDKKTGEDMTKLTVAFGNFANALKKQEYKRHNRVTLLPTY